MVKVPVLAPTLKLMLALETFGNTMRLARSPFFRNIDSLQR